jgi:xylulokinase
MASSYLVRRLTGAYVLDHHSASQCDPLYDMGRGGWAADWAADIAGGIELPELRWPAEVAGRVTAEAAAVTGLPAGIPMATGTIDAWAEAASVGVRRPGDTMLMYGTTMFIVEVVERFVPDRTLWGTAGVEPGSRTLAAGMSTSGALTGWFRELVGGPPFETLIAEAAATPAGAHGLVVLPYFAGERTPVFDADARGMILGLTLEHGRGHLYRALLESTGYGVRHILAALGAAGSSPRRIVAVGGGTKGGLWTRIVSDITGLVQAIPAVTIGAAYGDAFLAGVAAGVVDPGTDWTHVAEVVQPDERNRAVYDDLFDAYVALYPATRAQAHVLAALQRRAG